MIAAAAVTASSFDHRSRHTTLRTERTRHRLELCPALRTRRRPSPLKDSRIAQDTRLREEEIQDRVDHWCLSSTQRAKLIYFEYG
jgi:hypothetical protein